MNKAKKRLLLYAMLSVFVLLTVLLGVINGVNFTMAAEDADQITQTLADGRGRFGPESMKQLQPGRESRPEESADWLGPMGPSSPEMRASMRYFTYAFTDQGTERVAFELSAVTESEAEDWARSLLGETTGWTRGTYRYRVYQMNGKTYVTVIDQGRELLSCYRILIISAIGELLALALGYLFLLRTIQQLFAPLEEADRKQREFIAGVETEFKIPLTIISADAELIERKDGPSDQTSSIRRQVRQMSGLLSGLGNLAVFESGAGQKSPTSLSDLLTAELDRRAPEFAEKGVALSREIAPDVTLNADPEALNRMAGELVENALSYAKSQAAFLLKREGDRVLLQTSNDADLPDGPCDQVFDRFVTLQNARGNGRPGLGLAAVKSIVQGCQGRADAKVQGGVFTLRIAL